MQYKNIFKMLTEINMYVWKIKDSLNVSKQNYTYNFSYFSQCIASQLESNFLLPIVNRPNITAVFMRCMIQCSVLIQCTDFRGQSARYDKGCFSAVNRVKPLYSDNCDLKCHENSIEFKYA